MLALQTSMFGRDTRPPTVFRLWQITKRKGSRTVTLIVAKQIHDNNSVTVSVEMCEKEMQAIKSVFV